MAEEKRPTLRVVTPDETPSASAERKRERPEPSTLHADTIATYESAVGDIDASRAIGAAYLACAGALVADGAVSFYQAAASHAPAGTFRRDVPPGMKSAEATRAWVGEHLEALRKLADSAEPKKYNRGADARAAAAHTVAELNRALGAASEAGLWFDERAANLVRDAVADLRAGKAFMSAIEAPQPVEIADEDDIYVFGANVLGGCASEGRPS